MTDKRVTLPKNGLTHIEGPGVIVNIRTGLSHRSGKAVTSIEVLADGDRYAGDPQWWIVDGDDDVPPESAALSAAGYFRVMQVQREGRNDYSD